LSDVPFVISTLFSKTVQTAPYESEKAEVSAQFQVAEGVDAGKAIESGMSMVKTQVLVALGKVEGTLKAMSTTGEAPAVKRGPGRPKKEETPLEEPKQAIPDKTTEDKANPKPEKVEDEDFDFSDEPKKGAREITDSELQAACSEAAKVITAGVVKGVFQTKYGAARVSLIKANERQTFLDDLKTLMANKKAEG
jgi:hypothetical protein